MEPYSSYSSSSSSSTTYLSQKAKSPKLPQPFHSSLVLQTVRKSIAKPLKKPVAPQPPTPPRVYKVDPINFRDLVQKLTGAAELGRSRRLQSVAPPQLNVTTHLQEPPQFHHNSTAKTPFSAVVNQQDCTSGVLEMKPQKMSESKEALFSFEMNLSPTSHNWFSFPLLSPGSISSLERSTVL